MDEGGLIMNTTKDDNFIVEVEISSNGPIVRVTGIPTGSDFTSFDSAYILARKLLHRIKYLETSHELELAMIDLNAKVLHLWTEEDGIFRLSDEPKKNSHRIAFSLLRVYPECRTDADIIKDTGVKQSTANDQLLGKVKTVADYFIPCEKGYTLTKSGIDWLSTDVIPAINMQ